jgi:DNA-nicking Smr family endonuclease
MKLRDDDLHVWSVVAATVRPLAGRAAVRPAAAAQRGTSVRVHSTPARPHPAARPHQSTPQSIEPGLYRRIALGREPLGARLDLHGLDQIGAHAALEAFIAAAAARGVRGVLVVTGKGVLGDGVLRRRVPEWLAQPPLRPLIAGHSEAHRRHGGAGALYVALKRRER